MLSGADPLSARQRRDLGVIHRNASMLLGHVNDLLDLAKVDAGRMTTSYARIDLAQALRRVAEQFEALAPQRQLQYVPTCRPAWRPRWMPASSSACC